MNIGDLRDRVTVQQRTPTTDSHGGRSVSWGTFATLWANVRALTIAERLQATEVTSTSTYEVTLRARSDMSATMRLSWTPFGTSTAKTLQINGLRMEAGERDWLLLDCVEVQP